MLRLALQRRRRMRQKHEIPARKLRRIRLGLPMYRQHQRSRVSLASIPPKTLRVNPLTLVHSCYNNCPEHPDRVGAQTIHQQNCANARAYGTTTSATTPTPTADANASSYTGWMSASSSAADSEATRTPSGLKSNSETSGSGSDSGSSNGPTKALTGLEASSSPSHGAAAVNGVKAAGGWVAFLGLALGVLF